jgi:hypothetical protein
LRRVVGVREAMEGRTEVSVFVRELRSVEMVVTSPVAMDALRAPVWTLTDARRSLD